MATVTPKAMGVVRVLVEEKSRDAAEVVKVCRGELEDTFIFVTVEVLS